MGKSKVDKGKTTTQSQELSVDKPRSRRLATLGAIRREHVKIYAKLKDSKTSQLKMKVQHNWALCFTVADIMKHEKVEFIDQRLEELLRAVMK